MKTAVIYARYSSERQNEQSIEGQLSSCQSYASENGIIIVDTYIDRAMTGKNDNRKEFQRMLKDSYKQAWDYVIVYKLDRFSRNKYEMAIHKKALRDNGVKLLSAMERIPDTPEGIILESMLEGMAEYYSAELSQKVTRGLNENRKKGLHTGGEIVFGYKVIDKKIYIDEDQAEIVRYIYQEYASGVYVRDIISDLTNKGIFRHGKPFAENTIYRLLQNEKYIGILRHNGEIFTTTYPPIVPEDIFKIVQLKHESNKFGKHTKLVTYLLKGKIYCGHCGKIMTSDSGTSGNGTICRYYKCRGRKKGSGCKKDIIKKDMIETLIINTTASFLKDKDTLAYLSNKIIERNRKKLLKHTELNILNKEKLEVTKSLDNLLACLEQGIVTKSTKKRIEELEEKLEHIENNIAIERAKEQVQPTQNEIIKYIKHAIDKPKELLIKLLIDKVIVYDDKIEIYYKYNNKPKSDETNHQAFSFAKTRFEDSFKSYKFGQTDNIKLKFDVELFA